MKYFTKITSAVMAGVMVLSMSSCSLFGGSKIGPSALVKYAKSVDAAEFEPDDFMDLMDDLSGGNPDFDDIEDGAYVTLEGKDIKTYFKKDTVGTGDTGTTLGYDKSMKTASVYYIGEIQDSSRRWVAAAISIDFESKEDAENYFEDAIDQIEDGFEEIKSYVHVDTDDGEEDGINYFIANCDFSISDIGICEGIYQQGNAVLFILGCDLGTSEADGVVEEICEAMNVIDPSEA